MRGTSMKIYDSLEAAEFIAARTGLSREDIAKLLEARVRLDIIRGLVPSPESIWDIPENIEAHRAKNIDLMVPDQDLLDWSVDYQYFARNTDLPQHDIKRIMQEEIGYLVSIGTLKAPVYEQCKAWARSF